MATVLVSSGDRLDFHTQPSYKQIYQIKVVNGHNVYSQVEVHYDAPGANVPSLSFPSFKSAERWCKLYDEYHDLLTLGTVCFMSFRFNVNFFLNHLQVNSRQEALHH